MQTHRFIIVRVIAQCFTHHRLPTWCAFLTEYLDRPIQCNDIHIIGFRNGFKFTIMLQVGAKTTDIGDNGQVGGRMTTQLAWQ